MSNRLRPGLGSRLPPVSPTARVAESQLVPGRGSLVAVGLVVRAKVSLVEQGRAVRLRGSPVPDPVGRWRGSLVVPGLVARVQVSLVGLGLGRVKGSPEAPSLAPSSGSLVGLWAGSLVGLWVGSLVGLRMDSPVGRSMGSLRRGSRVLRLGRGGPGVAAIAAGMERGLGSRGGGGMLMWSGCRSSPLR